MVKTRLIAIALLLAGISASAQNITWETVDMDGHRTGTSIPMVDNVDKAIGTIEGKTYTAPNGRKYRGSTAEVARLMIEAQPSMSFVKEYIGYCPSGMKRSGVESALCDMIADCLMVKAAELTGLHIDCGLANKGGIRIDMPEGDVLMDDILSMLPFKNYIVVVRLKGKDLKALFEHLASHKIEAFGGAVMKVRNHKMVSLTVGGKPVVNDKIYNLATIDFLLDKGDGISAARNAVELINTDVLLRECLLPYLKQLTAEGKPIEYKTDGRITILD